MSSVRGRGNVATDETATDITAFTQFRSIWRQNSPFMSDICAWNTQSRDAIVLGRNQQECGEIDKDCRAHTYSLVHVYKYLVFSVRGVYLLLRMKLNVVLELTSHEKSCFEI